MVTDTKTITNIETENISNTLYVQAGNATDFQDKMNNCISPCKIVVPSGKYLITSDITCSENLTLIIEEGAIISLALGTELTNYTDKQGINTQFLIFCNGVDNMQRCFSLRFIYKY